MSELLAKKKKNEEKKKKTETVSPRSHPSHSRDNCRKAFVPKCCISVRREKKVADTHQSITAADSLYAREKKKKGLIGFSLRRTYLKMSPDGLFC